MAYSPYTKEQSKTIRDLWGLRKTTVGLEGDVYLRIKSENPLLSETQILEKVKGHFENVTGEKTAWESLRSEIKR